VKKRMDDLRHVQTVLKSSLERCRQTEQQGHCQVIDRLTATASASPKSPRSAGS
jgi:hypothetical protein